MPDDKQKTDNVAASQSLKPLCDKTKQRLVTFKYAGY